MIYQCATWHILSLNIVIESLITRKASLNFYSTINRCRVRIKKYLIKHFQGLSKPVWAVKKVFHDEWEWQKENNVKKNLSLTSMVGKFKKYSHYQNTVLVWYLSGKSVSSCPMFSVQAMVWILDLFYGASQGKALLLNAL